VIHLDGAQLAVLRGELTAEEIEQCAGLVAAELNLMMAPGAIRLLGKVRGSIVKAEARGDLIVEDTTGRLIAEVLECTPSDLGRNPPELPYSRHATSEVLREKQRRRLAVLIQRHAAAHGRHRANRDAHFARERAAERRADLR
jgi:hypothetical protein